MGEEETQSPQRFSQNESAKGHEDENLWMKRERDHKIQSGWRRGEKDGQTTLPHKKQEKKEMPQLEVHNVPWRAGPPTGVVTGQINSMASSLASFKLQKNV